MESFATGVLSAACSSMNLGGTDSPKESLLRFTCSLSSRVLLIMDGVDEGIIPECSELISNSPFLYIIMLRDDKPGEVVTSTVPDSVVLAGLERAAAEALVVQLNPDFALVCSGVCFSLQCA